ncbi:hypothetical protein EVA_12466 [gut metagenome]|uniref:Uncharacterized protein n=1 Tax=gut metagenome TaxID=749906 RepID=J9GCB4_9ZZZZ
MDTVGNTFYGHVLFGEDAFYSTYFLKFAVLVNDRHRVVEVGSMGHAGFLGSLHFAELGAGVGNGSHYAMLCAALDEVDRAFEFRSFVPTLETLGVGQQRFVFLCLRRLDPFWDLRTGHLRVEVRAFEVETEDGAVFVFHELVASFYGLFNHRYGRRRQGREDRSGTILHVGVNSHLERFGGAFHEVAAATAVYVHVDTARNDVSALGIDDFCTFHVQVVIGYCGNFVAIYNHTSVLQPSGRGKDSSVDDLFHVYLNDKD